MIWVDIEIFLQLDDGLFLEQVLLRDQHEVGCCSHLLDLAVYLVKIPLRSGIQWYPDDRLIDGDASFLLNVLQVPDIGLLPAFTWRPVPSDDEQRRIWH